MAYCRWSCDSFRSDLYVYLSDEGYMIHVASRRFVHPDPPPDEPHEWWKNGDAGVQAIMRFQEDHRAWRRTGDLVPIDLPDVGSTFVEATPEDAARTCERLRSLGYHVPQFALDALREEAAEEAQDDAA